MTLDQKRDGGLLVISIEGELDALSAPEVMTVIENDLDDVDKLVFDVSELFYTSSAGLRMFLRAQQIMDDKNGEMEVTGLNEDIASLFEVTGFDALLNYSIADTK